VPRVGGCPEGVPRLAVGNQTTLTSVVVCLGVAVVLVLPSLALLFWLDKHSRLEQEGA
jgi:hypothetical protein